MGVLTQAVNRHGYAPPQFDGRYLRLYEGDKVQVRLAVLT